MEARAGAPLAQDDIRGHYLEEKRVDEPDPGSDQDQQGDEGNLPPIGPESPGDAAEGSGTSRPLWLLRTDQAVGAPSRQIPPLSQPCIVKFSGKGQPRRR